MSLIAQTGLAAPRGQLNTPFEDRWLSSAEMMQESCRAQTELERECLLMFREIPSEYRAAIIQIMRHLARPAA